jgi:hypothetical protein
MGLLENLGRWGLLVFVFIDFYEKKFPSFEGVHEVPPLLSLFASMHFFDILLN